MNASTQSTRRMLSAAEYVLALHSPEDRVAVLLRNRARGRTTQRILAAVAIASPPFLYWLTEQNERGADIFVGMNPIKENSYTRTKENIGKIRHVYLDLDESASESLQAIRTSGDIPIPNFVLDTSPEKHQVIWRVDGLNQDQAESLLRSLATAFRGDPAATDISRVLRVPGFANRKYHEQFLVRAMQETDQIYHLRDFAAYEDSPDAPRHLESDHASKRTMPLGHRSQSEADWAYAKRALARGDNPEEIIRKIADFRSEDKADPDYYARRTVQQAQARLTQASREPFASGINACPALDKGPDH
jgi:RepB DNA-primase from phage plasmid